MRSSRWIPLIAVVASAAVLWWLLTTYHGPVQGIYLAGSRIPDENALGGFGEWDNLPKDLVGQDWGEAGTVSLIAFPDEQATYLDLRGFAVRLVNRTDKPAAFTACDSRLYLVQEALDRNGQWRAIELPPVPICGNSFHRVYLDKNQYWEFPAQRYSGWFQTKLRFRLEVGLGGTPVFDTDKGHGKPIPRLPERGGQIVYSNEFEGSINTWQFVTPRED
jgi:hypothetical protein